VAALFHLHAYASGEWFFEHGAVDLTE